MDSTSKLLKRIPRRNHISTRRGRLPLSSALHKPSRVHVGFTEADSVDNLLDTAAFSQLRDGTGNSNLAVAPAQTPQPQASHIVSSLRLLVAFCNLTLTLFRRRAGRRSLNNSGRRATPNISRRHRHLSASLSIICAIVFPCIRRGHFSIIAKLNNLNVDNMDLPAAGKVAYSLPITCLHTAH